MGGGETEGLLCAGEIKSERQLASRTERRGFMSAFLGIKSLQYSIST
jgi:hypothetical protein